jgi:hypothetical protein
VVGLGDTAVQESRERVRAAIRNSGFVFPIPKERQFTNHYFPLCDAKNWQKGKLTARQSIILEVL